MLDLCLCKHGRDEHVARFAGCLICIPPSVKNRPFVCKPGACDRFTWDPDAEELATKPKPRLHRKS